MDRKKVILQSNTLLMFWTVKMSPLKLAEIKRCHPLPSPQNVFSLLFSGCLPAVRMSDNHTDSVIYKNEGFYCKKWNPFDMNVFCICYKGMVEY